MRGISCLHPKIITNKYTGETKAVRCGKCAACLDSRAANWVQRIEQEMQLHKYTYFVTFQYDEQHVPQLIRVRPEHCKYGDIYYLDPETGEIFSFFDKSVPTHTKKDYQFVNETKVLNVPSVRDFQLFIKRLRKKSKKYGNFRYFTSLELGPQTFRPHAHTLFFFDSSLLSKNFPRLLVDSWKYGRVFDPHPVDSGSSARYVASYVNCFADIPAVYLHKKLRPKSLFSKNPPIGTMQYSDQDLQELFNKGFSELTLYDRVCNEFHNVPLWRFLQNRLYGRIQSFSSLSNTDRISLYRASEVVTSKERRYDEIKYYLVTRFPLYYYCITHPEKYFNIQPFKNFVNVVMRVAHNAALFGISVSDYVLKIVDYYEKKQVSDLKNWFRFQEVYFQTHSSTEIVNFDPYFIWKIQHNRLNEYEQKFIAYNGLPKSLGYVSTDDYQQLLLLHKTIYFNNTKTKKANDYLLKNKEKFLNVYNYKYE